MLAENRTERAVGFLLIGGVLVKSTDVTLDVEMLTYHLDKCGYDLWFGRHVGVESVFLGSSLLDIIVTLLTCIEVWIDVMELVEYE